MSKPFIYIGALRRTGSTMLCEALTQYPHSLVFNEPNVADGQFVIRGNEAELLAQYGIDLQAFIRRWSIFKRRWLFFAFRHVLLRQAGRQFAQFGVKEIFHSQWTRYRSSFPNLRIILTARDPRDIYLSLRSRYVSGSAIWHGDFNPVRVAENLNAEFAYQRQMAASATVLKVRYEELCLDPRALSRVLDFVESDIKSIGRLGDYLRSDQQRVGEGKIHGGQITDRRVERWKMERNDRLVEEAWDVFRRMPAYCEFWGYSD